MSASPYDVLGVPENATHEQIVAAWRVKVAKAHPDHGGDPVWFGVVNKAYELIGTPEKRAAYDRASRPGAVPFGAAGAGLGVADVAEKFAAARRAVDEKGEQVANIIDAFSKLFS